jgi:hypothetical protein
MKIPFTLQVKSRTRNFEHIAVCTASVLSSTHYMELPFYSGIGHMADEFFDG